MKQQSFVLCLALMLACAFFSPLMAQDAKKPAERIREWQQRNEPFIPVALNKITVPASLDQTISRQAGSYTLFDGKNIYDQLDPAKPLEMSFSMPSGERLVLLLAPVNNYTGDYSVVVSDGEKITARTGLHYQGVVQGAEQSVAAISIYPDETAGFFTAPEGNFVIGKIRGAGSKETAPGIIYRESSLTRKMPFNCFTPDIELPAPPPSATALTARCVRIYLEFEYDFFTTLGSAAAVNNYANTLFNQVKTLYNNDGISVALSQIFVWSTADPYTGTTTLTTLSQFQSTRTTFNGDVGELLTTRDIGGGRAAVINGLCSSNANRLCVSGGLLTSYPNVPTYSFTVMVTTHELGHLMGSRHTHACVWNGNNTAIDGCGQQAGYPEGSCATGPIPAGGGTIMSYCHLNGVGINFNNGFGSQPASKIRTTIEAAACLTSCAPPCIAPSGLSAAPVTNNSETLSWAAVSGAVNYMVEYKPASATVWISAGTTTSTSVTIGGLVAGTLYDWHVRTVCASNSSDYTAAQFTTTGTAPCGTPTMSYVYFNNQTSYNMVYLYWSVVPGATSYNIWMQPPYTAPPYLIQTNVSAPSGSYSMPTYSCCSSTGLYAFAVSANCAAGTGVISNYAYNYKSVYGRMAGAPPVADKAPAGSPNDEKAAYGNTLRLWPVPASDRVVLSVTGNEQGIAVLTVQNELGRVQQTKTVKVNKGSNSIEINVQSLPPGIYMVKLQTGGIMQSGKLVVVH